MKVNVNNMRKQTLYCYDRLATKLNEMLKEERLSKDVAEDIQQDMDDLRMYLYSAACVYIEGDPDYKDVSEEVGEIAVFNEQEEEA